ncbi:CotH kinase family protein [bacterium]|nr:CotH kinase family protein [bacterium]
MLKRFRPILLLLCFLFQGTVILSALDQRLYDDSEVAVVEISCAPDAIPWMWENVWSDSLHLASIHFHNAWIDTTVDSVGLRLRGNTSRPSQKKSFKLSFNTFVPGRQFFGVDKLNLNGEHNDPSIIRSKLCWDLYHTIGYTASIAAPTALYINGVYFGLYISIEHIDDEFLQDRFTDESGNLWKCLWPADLTWRGPNPSDYYPWVDDDRPYELKTNVAEYDYSKLVRLIDIINNTPSATFADSLEGFLEVAEFIEYFAVDALVGSWDDYSYLKNNFYLYHEPAVDRFHWVPYDYDNTFGVDWFGVDWAQISPWAFASPDPRPLTEHMLANPCYSNFFAHCLDFYNSEVFALSHWETALDSLHALITPWAEADSFRTLDYGFTVEDFHNSIDADSWNNQHVSRSIKEFVTLRNSSLPAQLFWLEAEPFAWNINWQPRQPRPTDSVQI